MGIPRLSPSSTTAPTTASSSIGRPASRSCNIEVLCSPTFSAPAMRWSIEIGISIPSFAATASTSVMMLRIIGPASLSRAICDRVARVRALMGLKATLPRILPQTSFRISSGIDAFQVGACVVARGGLEVPPGDAVLRADDRGVLTDERRHLGRELRQSMGLYAEKNDVHRPGFRDVANDARMHFEVAVRADYAQAAFLHGPQVRTACEQGDIVGGARQAGSDVSSDGACAGDQEFH